MRWASHWLLLAAAIATVHAAERDAAGLLAAIGEASRAGERRATFVEVKSSTLLTQPIESSGTLRFRAPDLLEKVTLAPQRERVTIEGDRVSIESIRGNGETRSITLRASEVSQVAPLIEGLRATLAGDIDSLSRHYDIALLADRRYPAVPANDTARRIAKTLADPAAWTLQLTPRDLGLRASLQSVLLYGVGQEIGLIEFIETASDRTQLWITPAR
jgi:negative regulator of sigma E activity